MLLCLIRPRIVTALLISFSVLVIPGLITALTVSYYQSEAAVRSHLDDELGRTKEDTTRAINSFFKPIVDVAGLIAATSSLDEELIRRESFNDVLYQALQDSKHLLSITVLQENRYLRSLSRVTPDALSQHPEFPRDAAWALRVYDSTMADPSRRGAITFFREYPTVMETRPLPEVRAYLNSPAYIGARKTGELFLSDAFQGVVSHLPIVGLAVPLKTKGQFSGGVLASIAVSELSTFLATNRISDNSESMIVDSDGQIIAASRRGLSVQAGGDPATSPAVDLAHFEQRIAQSDRLNAKGSFTGYAHSYTAKIDSIEFSISDFPVTNDFGLKYRALTFTPLVDFIGKLQRSRRNFTIVIAILLLVEVLAMIKMAHRMSGRIAQLSAIIRRIREMDFEAGDKDESPAPVQEIRELQQGVGLLQSALRSFALYVPFGVVKNLARDGKSIAPGVEHRSLTILFCDLENFSTMAQEVPPEELLQYTTRYFSIATEAITRNGGTVDKFIGDAVMAFWGAPELVADHAVRACRAAVEIVRGLEAANWEWLAQGKRNLRVRVGLNSAEVLVGNIGSPDRLSYTALGDGVNVASRLEGKNKELGSQICISDSTYELAKENIVVKPLKPVSVKGRTGDFMVYELLDAPSESEPPFRKAAQS
jgi:class 3 adenylate cyclase